MVGAAAGLPGGHAWVAGPPGWWVAGWYGVIATTLLALPRERLKRAGTWAVVAAAWIAVGLAGRFGSAAFAPRPPALRVVVASMGHGCGIVVQSPLGRCLVYDAGRLGAAGAAQRAMSAVLWSEGIDRIDTLVISHADSDHFNAVPELLERFAVGEIVVSRAFLASPSAGVAELLRLTREAGIPVRTVAADDPSCDSISFDPLCRVRVLHPVEAAGAGLVNDNQTSDTETSIVLAIEAAGRRLLLTGDLEGNALARFVAADPGGCDVLVAPHHGSRTSLPPDVARATSPDWVVASGVGGSAWEEVRAAYESARTDGGRSTVLKTGGDGAVAISFTAAGARVEQFSSGLWRTVNRRIVQPVDSESVDSEPADCVTPPSPFSTATLPPQAAENSR
jgi:competence protein ComEC